MIVKEENPHVLGELSSYLDGRLARSERKRVEAHLGTCESCAHHADDLMSLRKMVHPRTPSLFDRIPVKTLVVICGVLGIAFALTKIRKTNSLPVPKSTPALPAVKPTAEASPKTQPAAVQPAAKPAPEPVQRESSPLPQWQGQYSSVNEARTVVIQTHDEWAKLWQEHHAAKPTPPALPDLDFSQVTVLGVYAGGQPTGSYAIEIYEILPLPDHVLVRYRETPPLPNPDLSVQTIQPYHLRVVPKTALPVVFERQSIVP